MTISIGAAERDTAGTTREKILEAARELYELYGTRGTTTREIAERAHVNEATIFRHFGNKHALLLAMREHFCNVAQFERTVETLSGDLRRDLVTLAAALYDGIDRQAGIIRVSMAEKEVEPELADDAAWRGPFKIWLAVRDYLARQVERGLIVGEPLALAQVLMGMMFSAVMMREKMAYMGVGDAQDSSSVVHRCVDIFLNGVRRQ